MWKSWREGKGVKSGNTEGWLGKAESLLPSAVLHLVGTSEEGWVVFFNQSAAQMRVCSRQKVGSTRNGFFQKSEMRRRRGKHTQVFVKISASRTPQQTPSYKKNTRDRLWFNDKKQNGKKNTLRVISFFFCIVTKDVNYIFTLDLSSFYSSVTVVSFTSSP